MELEIPVLIVPKESSIFCAAGMLRSDLKHDFVRTHVVPLQAEDPAAVLDIFGEMQSQGNKLLQSEGISPENIRYRFSLDLRYVKQYHEVNVEITVDELQAETLAGIAVKFHRQHNDLFGYSLEDENTAVELINLRLMCIGKTRKPAFQQEEYDGTDPSAAFKKRRSIFLPLQKKNESVDVFDGLRLKFGNKISGPAIVEQVNTTALVSPEYNLMVDKFGSYTMYLKGRTSEVEKRILE
jgi:N-methylhydantoinase A